MRRSGSILRAYFVGPLEVFSTYNQGKDISAVIIYHQGEFDEFRPKTCCEGRDPEHQVTDHLTPENTTCARNTKIAFPFPRCGNPHPLWDLYFTDTRNLRLQPLVYGSAGGMTVVSCMAE